MNKREIVVGSSEILTTGTKLSKQFERGSKLASELYTSMYRVIDLT